MESMARCPQCGAMQTPAETCARCGAPLCAPASHVSPPSSEATTPTTPSPAPQQQPAPGETPRPRLSRLAVLSVLALIFFYIIVYLYNTYMVGPRLRFGPCPAPTQIPPWLEWATVQAMRLMLPVAVVVGLVGASRIKRSRVQLKGLGVARLGAWLGIVTIILFIILRSFASIAASKPPYAKAQSDAKTAVTQAVVYGNDKGVYPTRIKALRDAGYANIADTDPWGNNWVLSPVLTDGSRPKAGDDVFVYSKGPRGTGTYRPGTPNPGQDGAVGYSSVSGAFLSCPSS